MEGFGAMGHPIPADRKQATYDTANSMGIKSPENDRPFEAQQDATKFLDITGIYRLMAVLLTTPKAV